MQSSVPLRLTHPFANFEKNFTGEVFPASTEVEIGKKIKHLIDRAPPGITVTVGGERAFRGGAMHAEIEYLVILDHAPEVLVFNRINSLLLLSPTKELYKHLRWESDFSAWRAISTDLTLEDFFWWQDHIRNITKYPVPEELNRFGFSVFQKRFLDVRKSLLNCFPFLQGKFNGKRKLYLHKVTSSDIGPLHISHPSLAPSQEDMVWWEKERGRSNSTVRYLIDHPNQAVQFGDIVDYKTGNYLFDDLLYERLHQLALHKRILCIAADLTRPQDLKDVFLRLQSLNTPLALLDANNLFAFAYMGEENFRKFITHLLPLGSPDSILIVMWRYKKFSCLDRQVYLGFTFENVHTWPQEVFLDLFLDGLHTDLYPIIDGHLYTADQQLPLYLIER